MEKWECPCGYIYDPAEGDAENNIPVGTAFEDLPEDWVCPLCGAEKESIFNGKTAFSRRPFMSRVRDLKRFYPCREVP
jgi:rubredoxin